MRIEVFCDDPQRIVRYLAKMIPTMGDEPIRMKVQSIQRKQRPYDYQGYIEHVRGCDADRYYENTGVAEDV